MNTLCANTPVIVNDNKLEEFIFNLDIFEL